MTRFDWAMLALGFICLIVGQIETYRERRKKKWEDVSAKDRSNATSPS